MAGRCLQNPRLATDEDYTCLVPTGKDGSVHVLAPIECFQITDEGLYENRVHEGFRVEWIRLSGRPSIPPLRGFAGQATSHRHREPLCIPLGKRGDPQNLLSAPPNKTLHETCMMSGASWQLSEFRIDLRC